MTTRLLTHEEFLTCFIGRMKDVSNSVDDPIDIWPYVDSVPKSDLEGHVLDNGIVEYVWATDDDTVHHALVSTLTKNVYLAILVDVPGRRIIGHYLLDLNREYGLNGLR